MNSHVDDIKLISVCIHEPPYMKNTVFLEWIQKSKSICIT